MPNKTFFYTALLIVSGAIAYFSINLYSENEITLSPHIPEPQIQPEYKTQIDDNQSAPSKDTASKSVIPKSSNPLISGESNEPTLATEIANEVVVEIPNKDPSEILDQKITRLQTLEESIVIENKKLGSLIEQYDQDLGDSAVKGKLSSALLESNEYRANLLEKFKLEKEIENLN